MIKKFKNLPTGVKFLHGMIAVYFLVGLFKFSYLVSVLKNLLSNFAEIIPILCLAFFMVFLVNLYVKPEIIKKHLGHDSGIRGWLYAIIGSIIIGGPPYVIFPILQELKSHGMKNSLIVTFLNNRNVQPAFLPVMAYYFGLRFTVVLSLYIVLFAIMSGLIIGRILDAKQGEA